MIETLTDRVRRHEGLRLKPYTDTAGKITIGYGRNLTDDGISEAEADSFLHADLTKASADLLKYLPWSPSLDETRRGVLIEMVFQLGIGGLLAFHQTLTLVEAQRYEEAAAAMLESAWAKETPARAMELSHLMANGGPETNVVKAST